MGGKDSDNYERFCDVACKAFNLVRANARILISLFRMMVSTGIPELQSVDDIDYLRQALALDLNDDAARDLFRSLVVTSLLYLLLVVVVFFFKLIHNLLISLALSLADRRKSRVKGDNAQFRHSSLGQE